MLLVLYRFASHNRLNIVSVYTADLEFHSGEMSGIICTTIALLFNGAVVGGKETSLVLVIQI